MLQQISQNAAKLTQEQENMLLRFDEAWENGATPHWETFVSGEAGPLFLFELLHIDLERKLKQGLPARVECYVEARPDLCLHEDALIELIATEFRLRAQQEPVPVAEYVGRFPSLGVNLESRLNMLVRKTSLPVDAGTHEEPPVAGQEPAALSNTLVPEAPAESGTETINQPAIALEQRTYAFLEKPQGPDELGRLGNYRIVKVLGTGGMGVVFLAEDVPLRRMVALKVLKPGSAVQANARQRFLREAQAMAAVEHDNIVGVHQVGESNAMPFLAMQFLQGATLESCCQPNQLLPLPDVFRIGREIAEGLAAAHARGLIHRDIKPSNIWLEERADGSRRVRILDFGLARLSIDALRLTQSGDLMGTPHYMAPEQARDTKTADHRCDLFSLGCVLYELCTGQRPFPGSTVSAVLRSLMQQSPTPPRETNPRVPRAFSDLVMRLLAKNPEERPQTAREVADGLLPEPDNSRTETASPGGARAFRPGRLIAAGLLATVILLAAVIVIRLPSGAGELIIEADDPDIEVIIKQNGATIVDRTTKRRIELRPGDYGIELVEAKDGLRLSTSRFTLSRGGKEVVKVEWRPVVAQKKEDPKKEAKKPPLVKKEPAPPKVLLAVSAPDAKFAASMLSLGAKLRIRTEEGERDILTAKDVPTKGFRVLDIFLYGNPKIDDDSFPSLEGLEELRLLNLQGAKVGDLTMCKIRSAVKLRHLDLLRTRITDAGLFPALNQFFVGNTQVTAKGVLALQRAKPSCWISWNSPDRAAAEWALKRGGTVRIFPGHQEVTVSDLTQLPKELHLLEINQLRGA